jgi:hypothetical protein
MFGSDRERVRIVKYKERKRGSVCEREREVRGWRNKEIEIEREREREVGGKEIEEKGNR